MTASADVVCTRLTRRPVRVKCVSHWWRGADDQHDMICLRDVGTKELVELQIGACVTVSDAIAKILVKAGVAIVVKATEKSTPLP